MRILIVEDIKEISDSLKTNLEAECFAVDTAFDGEKGSYMARTNEYDLIILDFALPKKEGLLVCKEIRNAGKTVPIIVLSVRSAIEQKVEMLNAGVDDYLTKPFSFHELHARIQALLRRPAGIQQEILSVHDISLNKSRQRVIRGKKEIYLTRKEFALFEYLLKNKGDVVSRGAIMEHVWNSDSDPFSNTIEAHILNLRRKLESKNRKRFIFNVPGRGYKIDIEK